MSPAYKAYVLVCTLLGLAIGCVGGYLAGGILGLLAIGPMGALAGLWIASLGRHIYLAILELMS
jgi:hypothetical protein